MQNLFFLLCHVREANAHRLKCHIFVHPVLYICIFKLARSGVYYSLERTDTMSDFTLCSLLIRTRQSYLLTRFAANYTLYEEFLLELHVLSSYVCLVFHFQGFSITKFRRTAGKTAIFISAVCISAVSCVFFSSTLTKQLNIPEYFSIVTKRKQKPHPLPTVSSLDP